MRHFCIFIFLLISLKSNAQTNKHSMELLKNHWDLVNDDVMGGISNGNFIINDSCLTFSGKLSSKYNGGFASVRTQKKIKLDGKTKINIKIIGDGNTYQLRIKDSYYNYYSYSLEFETKEIAQELVFNLSDFKAIYRGTYIGMKNFYQNNIEEITFMIVSKNEPNFSLKIFDIYFN